MVDDYTPQDPAAVSTDPAASGGEADKTGFLSTTLGKVVLIAGAVLGFLIIAGLVTFAVMTFFFVDTAQDAVDQLAEEVASQSSSEETTLTIVTEPGEVPLSAIFTFRDIFEPLVKPTPSDEGTSTSGGSGSTGGTGGTGTDGSSGSNGGTDVAADTLYLQDVVVENGVSTAVLLYNGAEYRLTEGQTLADTPWKVLTIYSGSVTMLYGDSQVTLVVGQGIASK